MSKHQYHKGQKPMKMGTHAKTAGYMPMKEEKVHSRMMVTSMKEIMRRHQSR